MIVLSRTWLNFKGRWGSPVQLSFKERFISKIPGLRTLFKIFERPIREAGVPGPTARPGLCWGKPLDWVNLECLDAPKTSNWIGEVDGVSANEL